MDHWRLRWAISSFWKCLVLPGALRRGHLEGEVPQCWRFQTPKVVLHDWCFKWFQKNMKKEKAIIIQFNLIATLNIWISLIGLTFQLKRVWRSSMDSCLSLKWKLFKGESGNEVSQILYCRMIPGHFDLMILLTIIYEIMNSLPIKWAFNEESMRMS